MTIEAREMLNRSRSCHSGARGVGRDAPSGFLGNTRGGIAVNFSLALPVILMLCGGVVDYGMLLREKSGLQAATDAAAKAAALEFTMIDYTKQDISALVQEVVVAMTKANSTKGRASAELKIAARAQTEPLQVSVDATQTFKGYFGIIGGTLNQIRVRSVAQVVGRPHICVLGLDREAEGTIELMSKARMTAQNCAVYSNSIHASGIKSKNNATLSATMICSVGGGDGGKGNFAPEPITDCPVFEDPLASRPAPSVGGCTATDLVIVNETITLDPGVYCGGLRILGTSIVKLNAGVHVMKDGPLLVSDSASISGEAVGFHLTGTDARLQFDANTTISLMAPTSGVMAGLLFHESRGQVVSYQHQIMSDNARMLLGTLYLPVGELRIDAQKPVADQSAYTAIVARTIRLDSGPNLVLNTNYEMTSVPVPEGIKGVGQPVVLVQ